MSVHIPADWGRWQIFEWPHHVSYTIYFRINPGPWDDCNAVRDCTRRPWLGASFRGAVKENRLSRPYGLANLTSLLHASTPRVQPSIHHDGTPMKFGASNSNESRMVFVEADAIDYRSKIIATQELCTNRRSVVMTFPEVETILQNLNLSPEMFEDLA